MPMTARSAEKPGPMLMLAVMAVLASCSPKPASPPAEAAAVKPITLAPAADPSKPPAEWVAAGACPFEGCQYGKWTATRDVVLYDRPGGQVQALKIAKGEGVTALTGEVIARPARAVVVRSDKEEAGWGLTPGAVAYFLFPLGEGAVAVWKDGKAYETSIDFELRFDPTVPEDQRTYVWWAHVRRAGGATGWVKNAGSDFTGTDQFE